MHLSTDRIAHTTAFITPVVEQWLQPEIAQWVHHEGSTLQRIAHEQMLYHWDCLLFNIKQ